MKTTTRIATILLISLAVGCSQKNQKSAYQDPFFPPEKTASSVAQIIDQHAAAGAAADATLYPHHFDGTELNSLGATKLNAILAGRSENAALNLYLNFGKDGDELSDARQATVTTFAREAGVDPSKMAVKFGVNKSTLHRTDLDIKALKPTDDAASAGDAANASAITP